MATARWFYAAIDGRRGPVKLEDLVELIGEAPVPGETLVWRHGFDAWRPAGQVPEIVALMPPPLPSEPVAEAETPPASAPEPPSQPAAAPEPPPEEDEPEDTSEDTPEDNPFIVQLRKQYETNSLVFVQLAEEYRKEGRLEEAIGLCRNGLRRHPRLLHGRITLGRALVEYGDLEEARYELEAAVDALPQSVIGRRALGECLERLGFLANARAQYAAALAMAPDNSEVSARLEALETAKQDEPERGADEGDPLLGLPFEGRRLPDEDLPPLPLVPAEETFELEKPYDIPSVWQTHQPAGAEPPEPQPEFEVDLDDERGVEAGPAPPPEAGGAPRSVVWPARRLSDNTVPDVIEALHERRWSGVLALGRLGVEKTIRFAAGRVEFATSSDPDERLGEYLLGRCRITFEQYLDASALLGKGRRFGQILVELDVLSPKELVDAVVEQTQEIVYSAFEWTDGVYQLRENVELGAEDITLRLSTPQLILKGFERISSWGRVQRGAGDLDSTYVRAPGYKEAIEDLSLSLPQAELLELLAEPRDLRTLSRISELYDFELLRTLWAFRVIGIVQRLPPTIPPTA